MAKPLDSESIQNLLHQVKMQCETLEGLVHCMNKRLEGEIQHQKALTEVPAFEDKARLFKQAGRYHPLLETLMGQHKALAEQGNRSFKHNNLKENQPKIKPN